MLKKVLITVVVLIALALAAAGFFVFRYRQMANTIGTEVAKVQDIDLSKVADGKYKGSFGDFLAHVELEVSVSDHKITGIEIVKQECGPGYDGRATVDQILSAQSPKVDGVSGATGSSSCIKVATYQALTHEL